MTQQEFQKLTGTEVTSDTYDYIQRVYMAAGDMDKKSFCADWRDGYVSKSRIVSHLVTEVETCRATISNYENQLENDANSLKTLIDSFVDFLVYEAEHYSAPALRDKAIKLVGICEYLRRKIAAGFELWREDREALDEILKTK